MTFSNKDNILREEKFLREEKLKRGKLLEQIGAALGIWCPLENRESIIPAINKLKRENEELQIEIDNYDKKEFEKWLKEKEYDF